MYTDVMQVPVRLVGVIAAGSFGQVYKAVAEGGVDAKGNIDPTARQYAVKIFGDKEAFEHEYKMIRKCRLHKINAVACYGLARIEGRMSALALGELLYAKINSGEETVHLGRSESAQ